MRLERFEHVSAQVLEVSAGSCPDLSTLAILGTRNKPIWLEEAHRRHNLVQNSTITECDLNKLLGFEVENVHF